MSNWYEKWKRFSYNGEFMFRLDCDLGELYLSITYDLANSLYKLDNSVDPIENLINITKQNISNSVGKECKNISIISVQTGEQVG